jgi:transposase
MPKISQLLTKEVVERAEKSLKDLGHSGALSRKLSAICASKKHGITKVAEIYDISRTTLTDWIKNFKAGSLAGLKPKAKKPRSFIQGEQLEIVKKWLEQDSTITIKELKIKIEEELKIEMCMSSAHNLIKRLGFSYITPRPKHYKKDDSKETEFKKKSSTENGGIS